MVLDNLGRAFTDLEIESVPLAAGAIQPPKAAFAPLVRTFYKTFAKSSCHQITTLL